MLQKMLSYDAPLWLIKHNKQTSELKNFRCVSVCVHLERKTSVHDSQQHDASISVTDLLLLDRLVFLLQHKNPMMLLLCQGEETRTKQKEKHKVKKDVWNRKVILYLV